MPETAQPAMPIPADDLPPPPAGPGLDLLAGIRVLDLTNSIAGPYATLLLGDFGAEIVKVEQPGSGDDARRWGPPFLDGHSLWFLSVNRNKKSIAVDTRSPEGQAQLRALAGVADVLVTNQLPRTQEKLGIHYAAASAANPGLIHVSITGFGLEGKRNNLPCYDLIAEGYSGVMDLTGELDGAPQKVGTPAADLLSGHDAAMAVLAALVARGRDGRGRQIDVSMVESMTRFMTPYLVSYLGSGTAARRSGARDSVIAVYQTFEAADGPLTLGLASDAIWKRFWAAVGRPEIGDDPRYASNADRRAFRQEIVAAIGAILKTRSRAEWLELFTAEKVPAGPINRIDEIAEDAELRTRGFFYGIPRDGSPIPQVGLGIRIGGAVSTPRLPPPALGEHTEAILAEWLKK